MTKTSETYTEAQATDEAVLLLVRKLGRLHPEMHASLIAKLPDGARAALNQADIRADRLRHHDARDGIVREYVDLWTDDEN